MKNIKRIVILLSFMSLILPHAEGQVNNYIYLDWNINVPVSNTDWISEASTAGGKVGYRFFPFNNSDRISLGVDFSWTTISEYAPWQTFYSEDGAVSTDYFKYVYNNSLAISGQYYFPVKSDLFFPYAGLGLGANWNRYKLFYNIYEEEETNAGFVARPEAGILARFGSRRSMGARLAVHLDYSTNQSENYGYSNFSTLGFQLGIFFMNRY